MRKRVVYKCVDCLKDWGEVDIATVNPDTGQARCKWCEAQMMLQAFERHRLKRDLRK